MKYVSMQRKIAGVRNSAFYNEKEKCCSDLKSFRDLQIERKIEVTKLENKIRERLCENQNNY